MSIASQIALEKFRTAGFRYSNFRTPDGSMCSKIQFPSNIPPDAAERLSDGIQEAERAFGNRTTVWLMVDDLHDVPNFVDRAVFLCGAFGVNIFVSDALGNVSHGSKNVVQNAFTDKLSKAGTGKRWNDIEQDYFW